MLQKGYDRNQMQVFALESMISKDSKVRVIDTMVDMLDLVALGFDLKGQQDNGRPAYPAEVLLKLLYYGYLHKVRGSRPLAREAVTNIEAMWLCNGLQPKYKTIADFRKNNVKALEKSFYQLNIFLRSLGLFNEELVAIDGAKFRAQNSKKNNYNKKKVDQHLDYINKQTKQYLEEFDQLEQEEAPSDGKEEQVLEIAEKLDHLAQRKKKYTNLSEQVADARQEGQTQISTSDPDARSLPKKTNIVEVSYNVLTAVEADNKLIVNYQVTNKLAFRFQVYKLPFAICNACSDKEACAASKLKYRHGQEIQRNEYEVYIEENIERVKLNPEIYRQRQSIVEHPYGTIKRGWAYDYTLLKGMEKVAGEFAIVFTMYNLRRAMSIFGVEELIKRLEAACLLIIDRIWLILSCFMPILFKFDLPREFTFQQINCRSKSLMVCEGMKFC